MSFLSARNKAGLSQMAVAKEMGVTDAAVSMWETGKTRPRAGLLVKLAELEELYRDYRNAKNALAEYLRREDVEISFEHKETASGN